MNRSSDLHVRLFIAKRFIDEPEFEPVLQDRIENVATIQSLYWRSGPENQTPLQVRTATPAQSRIRRAFEALENEGILSRIDTGWRLSMEVVAACKVNAVQTAEDLLEPSVCGRTLLQRDVVMTNSGKPCCGADQRGKSAKITNDICSRKD